MSKKSLPNISNNRTNAQGAKKVTTPHVVEPRTGTIYLGVLYTELEKTMVVVLAERTSSDSASWQSLNTEAREIARFPWLHAGDTTSGTLWQFRLQRVRVDLQEPIGNSVALPLSSLGSLSLNNLDGGEINPSVTSSSLWSECQIDSSTLQPVIEFLKSESTSKKGMRPLGIDFTPLDELREHFFEKGISSVPINPTLIISGDEKFCVGPVSWRQLSEEPDAPFIVSASDLEKIPVISPIPTLSKDLRDMTGKPLRIVCSEIKQATDYYDFRPITQILTEQSHRIIEANIPEGQIDRLLETLVSDSPAPTRGSFTDFRLQNLFNLWRASPTRNAELENILLKLPTSARILEDARKLAVQEEIDISKILINAELADLQKRITALNKILEDTKAKESKSKQSLEDLNQKHDILISDIKALELKKGNLTKDVGDLEAIIVRQMAEAEERLTAEIARLKDRSAIELAALLPLRHALGLDNITVHLDIEKLASTHLTPALSKETPTAVSSENKTSLPLFPPFPMDNKAGVSQCEDMVEVITKLKKALNAQGGRGWGSLAIPTLAALLAGLLPVVVTEESGKFWQTVADRLCCITPNLSFY
jgi:hypothetical protein